MGEWGFDNFIGDEAATAHSTRLEPLYQPLIKRQFCPGEPPTPAARSKAQHGNIADAGGGQTAGSQHGMGHAARSSMRFLHPLRALP